jgi:hypothetical protein
MPKIKNYSKVKDKSSGRVRMAWRHDEKPVLVTVEWDGKDTPGSPWIVNKKANGEFLGESVFAPTKEKAKEFATGWMKDNPNPMV